MSRPLIIDAFPYHDEADILEMRLTELYDAVDWFVIVEADVTHQDAPKPSYFRENAERFQPWHDKIVNVYATGLPTLAEDPDPWARELAQREYIGDGLEQIGVASTDIILQSDVDEIPRALYARNVRPGNGMLSFGMAGHFWAVDWLYPYPWQGTVAATAGVISRLGGAKFGHMRNMRNTVSCPPHMQNSGWHFSWLGGPDRARTKVGSFCHPEVKDDILGALDNDNFYWREGWHVDGAKMAPVDVDDTWPKWIRDGNAPAHWYRPR